MIVRMNEAERKLVKIKANRAKKIVDTEEEGGIREELLDENKPECNKYTGLNYHKCLRGELEEELLAEFDCSRCADYPPSIAFAPGTECSKNCK